MADARATGPHRRSPPMRSSWHHELLVAPGPARRQSGQPLPWSAAATDGFLKFLRVTGKQVSHGCHRCRGPASTCGPLLRGTSAWPASHAHLGLAAQPGQAAARQPHCSGWSAGGHRAPWSLRSPRPPG